MYQLISDNLVKRLSDGATIPLPANESEGYKYQGWLEEGNTPLPIPGPTAEQLREAANVEARTYLLATDWYVVRRYETGVAVPVDVLTKRQAARGVVYP
jgi:hypothetical protein